MDYTENTSHKEYASKGVAGTALGLGIGALGLEVLGAGLGGILGNNSKSSDYQTKELAEKDMVISELKSQQIVDNKLIDVYTELRAQDKAQDAKISDLSTRVTKIEATAPLREQIVLGQVQNVANSVENVNTNLGGRMTSMDMALQGQICQINNTLSNITRQIVPVSAVCPEPMKRYNSWTAPTSAT